MFLEWVYILTMYCNVSLRASVMGALLHATYIYVCTPVFPQYFNFKFKHRFLFRSFIIANHGFITNSLCQGKITLYKQKHLRSMKFHISKNNMSNFQSMKFYNKSPALYFLIINNPKKTSDCGFYISHKKEIMRQVNGWPHLSFHFTMKYFLCWKLTSYSYILKWSLKWTWDLRI